MSTIKVPGGLSGDAEEVLWQLFRDGPTWDGDLASKNGRSKLIDLDYAARGDGWNWLTTAGTLLAIELAMGDKKEKWQRAKRRTQ